MPHLGQPRHLQLLLLLDYSSGGGLLYSWLLESTVFGGKLLLNLLLVVDLLGYFQWFRVLFCLDDHLLITRLYWLSHIESLFEILLYYLDYFLF